MQPIADQADEIYRSRVLRARTQSPIARMWEGPRLFEMACRITRAGALASAGPDGADAEYKRRLAVAEILGS